VLLVDTSVWVEVFRRGAPLDLEGIIPFDEIVTCPPVIQEILQGFRADGAFDVARDALLAFPSVCSPVPIEVFLEAAGLYRSARRAGLTVRSSVDCLIAACALRSGCTVVHRDRDFDALARVSSLRVMAVS
jgi:predicted nucleic acid-binding protein